MEAILNVSTYISALWCPSVFSSVYIFLALCISVQILQLRVQTKTLYFSLLATAFVVIALKSALLIFVLLGRLPPFCGTVLTYLGFNCAALELNLWPRIELFANDVPMCMISVVSLSLKPESYKKSMQAMNRYWIWLVCTYVAVAGVAAAACSYMNLIYLAMAVIWGLNATYRNQEARYVLLCGCTFGVSVWNVMVFYIQELVLKAVLSSSASEQAGLDFFSLHLLPSDALILLLLYLSIKTFQLSWYRFKTNLRLPSNPFANLSPAHRSVEAEGDVDSVSMESPGDSVRLEPEKRWSWLRSVDALYFLLRVLITVWAVHFMSVLGVVQLFWLFKSIFVGDSSKAIKELPSVILPTLVLQVFGNYIITILDLHPPSKAGLQYLNSPQLEVGFMLFTISLCFLCFSLDAISERSLLPSTSTSVTNLALTILLQNSDKLALCFLFGVGLSKINVLYAGLMALCLLFALSPKTASKHWMLLVGYTIFLIALPYCWILVLQVWTCSWTWWEDAANILGLPLQGEYTPILEVIPPDYLSWSLLLAVSMQLSAYRSMAFVLKFRELGLRRMTKTYSSLLQFLTNVFRRIMEMQVWVVYCLMLLVVFVSDLNVLNYIRYLQILGFIVLHLHCGNESLSRGYQKVKGVWGSLAYSSGFIIVVRYLYQFRVYYNGTVPFQWYLEFAGLRVYSVASLYESMIGDCVLFIVSVFTAKSFHTETRIEERLRSSVGSSFSGEGGILYELLRADATSREEEGASHYHTLMTVIAGPFTKVVLLAVGLFSIYWRLAASFWVMLMASGLYIALEIGHQHYLESLQYCLADSIRNRYILWNSLFLILVSCMIMEYGVFLIDGTFIPETDYETAVWVLSVLGFQKTESGQKLLSQIYGYAFLLLLLSIEKHCIEYCESEQIDPRKNYHWDSTFQVWVSFRVIVEEVIVMCVLICAFNTLTAASVLYVGSVVLTSLCPTSLWRLRVIGWVVLLAMVGGYGVMLSNIGNQVSPAPISPSPFPVPWYPDVQWTNPEDDPMFLGLGTSQEQLYRLSESYLILLLCLCFFEYLADKQFWLCDVTDADLFQTPLQKPISRHLKTALYNSAHFFILILVLVFISQSTGLTSLIYCLIVLALLFKANELIRGEEQWNSYIKILTKCFIPIILFDFSILIVYQMPYIFEHMNSGVSWQSALGLMRLWRAGGNTEPANPKTNYLWVLFKVFTHSFLRLMIRMFTNDDFVTFMQAYRAEIWAKAASIGLEMSQDFNNQRLEKSAEYRSSKQTLDKKLTKIDELVSIWHKAYFSPDQAEALSKITNARWSSLRSIKDSRTPLSQKCIQFLLKGVNQFLFQEFVHKLAKKAGSGLGDPIYELKWKDWGYLMLYILFSNTESMCYFLFFLNHLVYASVESVCFPISVLW